MAMRPGDDCAGVQWFSSRILFADLYKCFEDPRIVRIVQDYMNLSWMVFIMSWIPLCIINRAACGLSTWLSMRGLNPVLMDNSPYLSYHSQTQDTYINTFGFERKTPELLTKNPKVQIRIDEDLAERRLEDSIIKFKLVSSNRGIRAIKIKLGIPEYEDLNVYQAVIWPGVIRWIFLAYSVVYCGVLVWLFIYHWDHPYEYFYEGKLIVFDNQVIPHEAQNDFKIFMIGLISLAVVLDEIFMVYYNFVKWNKGGSETGFWSCYVKYHKWVLGALVYWQLQSFNIIKLKRFDLPYVYWSFLSVAKLVLNLLVKYPTFSTARSVCAFLGFVTVEFILHFFLVRLWEHGLKMWVQCFTEMAEDVSTVIVGFILSGVLIDYVQGAIQVKNTELGSLL